MNKLFVKTFISNLKSVLLILVVVLNVSCVSVKPIYEEPEQAKAERAVDEFYKFYNEQNFEALYNFYDEEIRLTINKEEFLTYSKQEFEKTGKVQSWSLSQAKVFPVSPIQVRMAYNLKFENYEDTQHRFIWVIRGNEARLVQLQGYSGFHTPQSKQ